MLETLGSLLLIIGIWFGFITIKSSKELTELTINFMNKMTDLQLDVHSLNKRFIEQTEKQSIIAIQFKEYNSNLNDKLINTISQERQLLCNHLIDFIQNDLQNPSNYNNPDNNNPDNNNLNHSALLSQDHLLKEDIVNIEASVAKFTDLIENIVKSMQNAILNDTPDSEKFISILNKHQESTDTLISKLDAMCTSIDQLTVNSNYLETIKDLDIARNDSLTKILLDLNSMPEAVNDQLDKVKSITENVLSINVEISENSSKVIDSLTDNYKVLNTIVEKIM